MQKIILQNAFEQKKKQNMRIKISPLQTTGHWDFGAY